MGGSVMVAIWPDRFGGTAGNCRYANHLDGVYLSDKSAPAQQSPF